MELPQRGQAGYSFSGSATGYSAPHRLQKSTSALGAGLLHLLHRGTFTFTSSLTSEPHRLQNSDCSLSAGVPHFSHFFTM
jgi:hypothetical protein